MSGTSSPPTPSATSTSERAAAARATGLEVRAVVLTPWPAEPSAMERSNRETIERLGAVEVQTLAPIASGLPGDLAAAGETLPLARWLA